MNFFRPSAVLTIALVFCACAVMIEGDDRLDWRAVPAVQKLFQNSRAARLMTQGPIGNIIDIIVNIFLILLDILLGGNTQDFMNKFKSMTRDVDQIKALMSG